MDTESHKEIILKTPVKKTAFNILFSAGIFGVGLWLIEAGNFIGWLIAVLFGMMFMILTIQLIRGKGFLRINLEGFSMGSIGKAENPSKWEDLSEFKVVSYFRNSLVGFNFSSSYEGLKLARAINSNTTGVDGVIPSNYGLMPEELAELLTSYKQQAEKRSRATR